MGVLLAPFVGIWVAATIDSYYQNLTYYLITLITILILFYSFKTYISTRDHHRDREHTLSTHHGDQVPETAWQNNMALSMCLLFLIVILVLTALLTAVITPSEGQQVFNTIVICAAISVLIQFILIVFSKREVNGLTSDLQNCKLSPADERILRSVFHKWFTRKHHSQTWRVKEDLHQRILSRAISEIIFNPGQPPRLSIEFTTLYLAPILVPTCVLILSPLLYLLMNIASSELIHKTFLIMAIIWASWSSLYWFLLTRWHLSPLFTSLNSSRSVFDLPSMRLTPLPVIEKTNQYFRSNIAKLAYFLFITAVPIYMAMVDVLIAFFN